MSACLGIWARRRRQRYFVVVASAIVCCCCCCCLCRARYFLVVAFSSSPASCALCAILCDELTDCLPACQANVVVVIVTMTQQQQQQRQPQPQLPPQQQSSDAALSLCEFRLETFLPFASLLLSLPQPLPLLTALWLLFIYFLLCQLIFLAPKKNCICPIAKSNSAPILIRQANSNFD